MAKVTVDFDLDNPEDLKRFGRLSEDSTCANYAKLVEALKQFDAWLLALRDEMSNKPKAMLVDTIRTMLLDKVVSLSLFKKD